MLKKTLVTLVTLVVGTTVAGLIVNRVRSEA